MNTRITAPPSIDAVADDFDKVLKKGMDEVEERIRENCRHDQTMIKRTAEHALLSGGKRLRSRFILASHLIFQDGLSKEAIDTATAAELFHTATLLHDDVLDEANLRRGREAVNAKWGMRHAVLLGDYLLSRSFRLLRGTDSMQILASFIETALDLAEGALTEQIHKDDLALNEEVYLSIIVQKTASFFSTCAGSGAMLAGTSDDNMKILREFGRNFGMAFQITDDIMDVVSDESTMGKPRGQDILEGHLTLPLIKYFEKNSPHIPAKKLSELKLDDPEFIKIMEGLNRDGALSYSYTKADDFIRASLASLDRLPPNAATTHFKRLACDLSRRKA